MKYRLEFLNENSLLIHYDKGTDEVETPQEWPYSHGIIAKTEEDEEKGDGGSNCQVLDAAVYLDDLTLDMSYEINRSILDMTEIISKIKGIIKVEVFRYSIHLGKSPVFDWNMIINEVLYVMLLFLDPSGKAREIKPPFLSKENKFRKNNKKWIKNIKPIKSFKLPKI